MINLVCINWAWRNCEHTRNAQERSIYSTMELEQAKLEDQSLQSSIASRGEQAIAAISSQSGAASHRILEITTLETTATAMRAEQNLMLHSMYVSGTNMNARCHGSEQQLETFQAPFLITRPYHVSLSSFLINIPYHFALSLSPFLTSKPLSPFLITFPYRQSLPPLLMTILYHHYLSPFLTTIPYDHSLPPGRTTLLYHLSLSPFLTTLPFPYHGAFTPIPYHRPLSPFLMTIPYHRSWTPTLPPFLTTSSHHLALSQFLTLAPYHHALPPFLISFPYHHCL